MSEWKAVPSVTTGGKSHFHVRIDPRGTRRAVVWDRQVRAYRATIEQRMVSEKTVGFYSDVKTAKRICDAYRD